MLARLSRTTLLFGIVAIVALLVRATFWAQVAGTPLDEWHEWDQTDMATYIEQARRIAAGDILAVEPYHPFHGWQSAAGTPEDWLRWYGPHGFHQAPLYSYLLAAASHVTDSYLVLIRSLQLLLGVGTCLLLGLLARRLAGDVAGVATATFAALYGPLYYVECQFLREGPALFAVALVLWLVVRHAGKTPASPGVASKHTWRDPFCFGVGLGVFAMFHEFAPVIAVATLLIVGVQAARRSARTAALACLALFAGSLVGFAPLLARNVAVGAAPFQVSSRAHITLAMSNQPEARDGGVLFVPPGPELKPLLDAAGNSTSGVLRELWRAYDGDVGRIVGNWLRRLRASFVPIELPDNTSFGFYRANVGVLATSLTFGLAFPLGMAAIALLVTGAALARRRNKTRSRAQTPAAPVWQTWLDNRSAHLTVLVHLPLLVGATTLVNSVARYRLLFVPIFLIYAGVFVALAVQSWRARRFFTLAGLAMLAVTASLIQNSVTKPWADLEHRWGDWVVVGDRYSRRGDETTAVAFYRTAVQMEPRHPEVRIGYAGSLLRLGRLREAKTEFQLIATAMPDDPRVRRAIEFLEQKLPEHPAAEPTGPGATKRR